MAVAWGERIVAALVVLLYVASVGVYVWGFLDPAFYLQITGLSLGGLLLLSVYRIYTLEARMAVLERRRK